MSGYDKYVREEWLKSKGWTIGPVGEFGQEYIPPASFVDKLKTLTFLDLDALTLHELLTGETPDADE